MQQKLFSKNFTLVVIGQIISLFGNATIRFALPLYLLNQTGIILTTEFASIICPVLTSAGILACTAGCFRHDSCRSALSGDGGDV